jgi:hypothetical protein
LVILSCNIFGGRVSSRKKSVIYFGNSSFGNNRELRLPSYSARKNCVIENSSFGTYNNKELKVLLV